MTRAKVLSWLVGVGALSISLTASQAPPAQPKVPLPELTRVKDNLYIIGSSAVGPAFTGGNIAVFIMEKASRSSTRS